MFELLASFTNTEIYLIIVIVIIILFYVKTIKHYDEVKKYMHIIETNNCRLYMMYMELNKNQLDIVNRWQKSIDEKEKLLKNQS